MLIQQCVALGFVEYAGKGGMKAYLAGIVGSDRLPTTKDFESSDPEDLEKCDEFVDAIQSIVDSLTDHIRNRPRQSKLIPSKDGSKLEATTGPKTDPKGSPRTSKPSKKKTAKKKTSNKGGPKK